MNVIGRRFTGAEQEFEPAAALALCADFAAADEIAFRDDADQLAGRIDHRKSADMPLAASALRPPRMVASGVTVMTDRVMI